MLERLKQAALVLAGYRPAEVRFDRWDQIIAGDIAAGLAWQMAQLHPEIPGSEDELDQLVERAIRDYVTWEDDERRDKRARRRRKAPPFEQLEIPF